MRFRLPLAFLLLACAASAQEPKTGLVDGDHKGCHYQLAVPATWKKADSGTYAMYITFPPGPHEGKMYGHLWNQVKGPKPHLGLCLDGSLAASEVPELVEKIRKEYGFDGERVFCVSYSEGTAKAFQFVADNADLLAGWIILQPSTQNKEPKAGGKSVPVLIMNDKACTYSPPFQAEGLKDKLVGLGYEATLVITDNPAEHDGWPVKDMSKIFEWTAALAPAKVDGAFDEAAAWLAEGAKDTEHRPKLRAAVKKALALFGTDMSPGGLKTADDAVASALKDAVPTVKEIKGGLKGQIALVAAAKGKKVEAGSLVLCDSAEFDVIEDSIVICSGDVKANKVTRSVIFAKGAVTVAKDGMSCVIYSGGHVKFGTTLEDSTLLATGGLEAAGKAKNNWFVNTAEVKIKANEAPRTVKRQKLPGGK